MNRIGHKIEVQAQHRSPDFCSFSAVPNKTA